MNILKYKKQIAFILIVALTVSALVPASPLYMFKNQSAYAEDNNTQNQQNTAADTNINNQQNTAEDSNTQNQQNTAEDNNTNNQQNSNTNTTINTTDNALTTNDDSTTISAYKTDGLNSLDTNTKPASLPQGLELDLANYNDENIYVDAFGGSIYAYKKYNDENYGNGIPFEDIVAQTELSRTIPIYISGSNPENKPISIQVGNHHNGKERFNASFVFGYGESMNLNGSVRLGEGLMNSDIEVSGHSTITSPRNSIYGPISLEGTDDCKITGYHNSLNLITEAQMDGAPPALGTPYTSSEFGNLSLKHVTINAYSEKGAAIGSAMQNTPYSIGGFVNINQSTINARSVNGSAIGAGYKCDYMPFINIVNNSKVEAISSETAIGGGDAVCGFSSYNKEYIFIDSQVNAKSDKGPAIGYKDAYITIENGVVNAKSENSYGIQAGYPGEFVINGGYLNVEGTGVDIYVYQYSNKKRRMLFNGGSIFAKNNSFSPLPENELGTALYKTYVPATNETLSSSLKGHKEISYEYKSPSGGTTTYKAQTVYDGSSNEHGTGIPSNVSAVIYMPLGYHHNIKVASYNYGIANVTAGVPTDNDNIVFFAKENPQGINHSSIDRINLRYGEILKNNMITGGIVSDSLTPNSPIPGVWELVGGERSFDIGSHNEEILFFPRDDDTWILKDNIGITVGKGQYNLDYEPMASDIKYGQKIKESSISGGRVSYMYDGKTVKSSGRWEFVNGELSPPVGTVHVAVRYIPTDSEKDKFEELITYIELRIKKNTPEIDEAPTADRWLMPESAGNVPEIYLTSAALTGGSVSIDGEKLDGRWEWVDKNPVTYGSPGTYKRSVVFKLNDDNDEFDPILTEASITVFAADTFPEERPGVEDIYFGQSLADTKLIGGRAMTLYEYDVPGEYIWQNDTLTASAVGSWSPRIIFIPENEFKSGSFVPGDPRSSVGYLRDFTYLNVTVKKAPTEISVGPDYGILYKDEPLSKSNIVGGEVISTVTNEVVDGTWSWKNKNTVPDPNETDAWAVFTPTESDKYEKLEYLLPIKIMPFGRDEGEYRVYAPSPQEITYGQIITNGSLSGGKVYYGGYVKTGPIITFVSEEVPGKWFLKEPAGLCDVGSTSLRVVFMVDQTLAEGLKNQNSNLKVNISPADLTDYILPTAGSINYGESLKNVKLTGGAVSFETEHILFNKLSIDGDWKFINEDLTPNAGTTDQAIEFVVNKDDAGNFNPLVDKIPVTVSKGAAYLETAPQAESPLILGSVIRENLSSSALIGGEVRYDGQLVSGSWSWEEPEKTFDAIGIYTEKAIFLPDDEINFIGLSADVEVTVLDILTEVVEPPTAGAIYYGNTLGAVELSGGRVLSGHPDLTDEVDGKFTWANPNAVPVKAGTWSALAVFTPDELYDPVVNPEGLAKTVTMVSIYVSKAAVSIDSEVTASSIYYGQSINNSEIFGGDVTSLITGNKIAGKWHWNYEDDELISSGAVGVNTISAIFKPLRAGSYEEITTDIAINVKEHDKNSDSLNYILPTSNAINYGDYLDNSILTGGSVKLTNILASEDKPSGQAMDIEGTWSFIETDVRPDAPSTTTAIKFTPSGSAADIVSQFTDNIEVEVNPVIPNDYVAPEAGSITYGQILSEAAITQGAVTFTAIAADESDNIALKVEGRWAFNNPGKRLDKGTHYEYITFTPSGEKSENYLPITTKISITVASGTPQIITLPSVTTKLMPEQENPVSSQYLTYAAVEGGVVHYLNSSIPGTWTWENTQSAVTFSSPGSFTASALFSPYDESIDTVTTDLAVTVLDPYTFVTSPPSIIDSVPLGTSLGSIELSGGVASTKAETGIDGHFEWADDSIELWKSGVTKASIKFIPDNMFDEENMDSPPGYFQCTTDISIKVDPGTLEVVEKPNAKTISYGQSLDDATLSGGAVISKQTGLVETGTWKWTEDAAVDLPGVTSCSAVFEPDDKSYDNAYAQVSVTVTPAVPGQGGYEYNKPKADSIKYGKELGTSDISGKVTFKGESVSGEWSLTHESDSKEKPEPGDYKKDVTFVPKDTSLYNKIQSTTTITVKKKGGGDGILDVLFDVAEFLFKHSKEIKEIYDMATKIWKFYKEGKISKKDLIRLALKASKWAAQKLKEYIDEKNKRDPDDPDAYDYKTPYIDPDSFTYGRTISDDMIKGGSVKYGNKTVAGSWHYLESNEVIGDLVAISPHIPTVLNTVALLEFRPTDSKNYATIVSYADISVTAASLNTDCEWVVPVASGAALYKKLRDVELVGGTVTFNGRDVTETVEGDWTFKNPDEILDIGTNTVDVIFEPTGYSCINYIELETTMDIEVSKADVIIEGQPQADRSIVTKKDNITLPRNYLTSAAIIGTVTYNGNEVEGSWNWIIDSNTQTTFTEAGNYTSAAIFTPTDTTRYNQVTSAASFTVYDRYTEIVEAPTTNAIYYGQSLSANTVLYGGLVYSPDAGGTVDGIFSWLYPNSKPTNTGTWNAPVIFRPTDMYPDEIDGYAPSITTVAVTVSKAATSITEEPVFSSISYGQSLADSVISGGSVVSAIDGEKVYGKFSIASGSSIVPSALGETTCTAIFTPYRTDLYRRTAMEAEVNVTPAEPFIGGYEYELPEVSPVTYGAILTKSALLNGPVTFKETTVVEGEWMFDRLLPNLPIMPSLTSDGAATTWEDIRFEPGGDGAPLYEIIYDSVSIHVNKAMLSRDTDNDGVFDFGGGGNGQEYTYEAPKVRDFTYGDTLSSSALLYDGKVSFGSIEVKGHWEFVDPDLKPDVGTETLEVSFVADGDLEYNLETIVTEIPVNISPAELIDYRLPEISSIDYGESLAKAEITGGAVVFRSENYAPTLVEGEWKFINPLLKPDAGVTEVAIVFTPTGEYKDNYQPITTTASIKVNKGTGNIIAKPEPSHALIVEQPNPMKSQFLTSTALIGGVVMYRTNVVKGSWQWENTETPVSYESPGVYTQSAIFTPNDTKNFVTLSAIIDVTVVNVLTTIEEAPTGRAIYYGQPLAAAGKPKGGRASAGEIENVTGSFIWVNPELISPEVGEWKVLTKFEPEDEFNPRFPRAGGYASSFTMAAITVSKASLQIEEAPDTSSITYGQEISESNISGGVVTSKVTGDEIDGEWKWIDDSITGSSLGRITAEAVFVPEKSENYETLKADLEVLVTKAEPGKGGYEYSRPKAKAITYGAVLTNELLYDCSVSFGGVSVDGTWRFKYLAMPEADSPLAMVKAEIVFLPERPSEGGISPYGNIDEEVWVKIYKAKPSEDRNSDGDYDYGGGGSGQAYISASPKVKSFEYGDRLREHDISNARVKFGLRTISGTWKYDNPLQVPEVNTTKASVTFYPDDPKMYNLENLSTIVALDISPAVLDNYKLPEIGEISYGSTLGAVTLTGGSVIFDKLVIPRTLEGYWSFKYADAVPEPLATRAALVFTPTGEGSENYEPITTTVSVRVTKADLLVDTKPDASSVTYGCILSDSKLTGGVVKSSVTGEIIPGTWEWVVPKQSVGNAGNHTFKAVFKPSRSDLYNGFSEDIDVIVNKAIANRITPIVASNGLHVAETPPVETQYLTHASVLGGVMVYDGKIIRGDWQWTNTTTPVSFSAMGVYTQSAVFYPNDSNYDLVYDEVNIYVYSTLTYIDEKPASSEITYGQQLSVNGIPINGKAVTDKDNPIDGSFEWVNPNFKPYDVGQHVAVVKFEPENRVDFGDGNPDGYLPAYTTIAVIVNQAEPIIDTNPVASNLEYGQTLSQSIISGGLAKGIYLEDGQVVEGTFTWKNPDEKQTVSGTVQKEVVFTPANPSTVSKISALESSYTANNTYNGKYKATELTIPVTVGAKPSDQDNDNSKKGDNNSKKADSDKGKDTGNEAATGDDFVELIIFLIALMTMLILCAWILKRKKQ